MSRAGGPVTLHCAPLVLPIDGAAVPDGAVAVADGLVVAVGPRPQLRHLHPGAAEQTWPGLLTPGLVNAHTHLQYTDFADLADPDAGFATWIRRVAGRRREFDPAAWAASADRGALLALRSGTTCIGDVVSDQAAFPAVFGSGLVGVGFQEIVGQDDDRWRMAGRTSFLERLSGGQPDGLAVGVAPHALYTVGTGVLRDCLRLARDRGLRLHMHLAETAAEVLFVRCGAGPFAEFARAASLSLELAGVGAGCSPVAALDRAGGLAADCHIAHGVHVDAADRALLAGRGVTVALCPRSNQVLDAGVAPVARYLEEAGPVAVGTDSLASSPSLDLLEDVRQLRRIADAQECRLPDVDRRLVEALMLGGARALGRTDVGRLVPGTRADLAVFDLPPQADDPYRVLVERGAGRCVGTVLGGRVVYDSRTAVPA